MVPTISGSVVFSTPCGAENFPLPSRGAKSRSARLSAQYPSPSFSILLPLLREKVAQSAGRGYGDTCINEIIHEFRRRGSTSRTRFSTDPASGRGRPRGAVIDQVGRLVRGNMQVSQEPPRVLDFGASRPRSLAEPCDLPELARNRQFTRSGTATGSGSSRSRRSV
jgi:hypothetical protein